MPLNEPTHPPSIITLDDKGIAQLVKALIQRKPPSTQRAILAIAGVPGSGKSTLAKLVLNLINAAQPGAAVGLPMDAYHMTNDKLVRLGLRNRKGAVQTSEAQQYFKHLSQARDARNRVSL
ncbi:MAG: hypothetical protein AB8C95_13310, partial [Phycisphaeraceae bacterium]